MLQHLAATLALIAPQAVAPPAAGADDLALEVLPLPAGARAAFERGETAPHVLADPQRYVWGASVARGDDGRWHLFHSRWPRAVSFRGWLTHSEIAHAVADDPAGPYRHLGVALAGRGAGHWDALTAHNPAVARFDGSWYLYYIATRERPADVELEAVARTGYAHGAWMTLRNSQRTGVAVAEAPEGPWRRLDAPLLEPGGPIRTLTVNPAVARAPDGTVLLIVKGDKHPTRGSVRDQALALAPGPSGPFVLQDEAVIDDRDTEDAALWHDARRGRFYAVFHAHDHIGLITSADGRRWAPAAHPVVLRKADAVALDDGTRLAVDRLERPFVLLDARGAPSHLFVAVKRGDRSADLALPLARGAPGPR